MSKDENQILTPTIEGTVNEEMLTIEYWRRLFAEKETQFSNIRDIADQIGKLDSDFEGVRGYFKLRNAHAGRASMKVTVKVVQLMEIVKPSNPKNE